MPPPFRAWLRPCSPPPTSCGPCPPRGACSRQPQSPWSTARPITLWWCGVASARGRGCWYTQAAGELARLVISWNCMFMIIILKEGKPSKNASLRMIMSKMLWLCFIYMAISFNYPLLCLFFLPSWIHSKWVVLNGVGTDPLGLLDGLGGCWAGVTQGFWWSKRHWDFFPQITINYMTLNKKILNRGRFIFADWMPNAKTAKIRQPQKKPVYSNCFKEIMIYCVVMYPGSHCCGSILWVRGVHHCWIPGEERFPTEGFPSAQG